MERMMKVQDVLLKAMARKITWWAAAEILGVTDRTMRRWREKLIPGCLCYRVVVQEDVILLRAICDGRAAHGALAGMVRSRQAKSHQAAGRRPPEYRVCR